MRVSNSTRLRPATGRFVPRRREKGEVTSRRDVIEKHLLDVATKQFARVGYRQTTLDKIARQAGVAKASIYRYFDNKQDLLCKIFLAVGATFTQALEPIVAAPLPPEEKLRRATQYLLRIISENIALFTVFYSEESGLPSKLRAEVNALRQHQAAGLEEILREGMGQGVFRQGDAKLLVRALIGMCGWLHKWYHPGEDQLEEVTATFITLLERGCLATHGINAQNSLADRLRDVQDTVGALAEHAEHLEKSRLCRELTVSILSGPSLNTN